MSWELVAAIVVAVWVLGLGLLVVLMRAASRGDAMLDAESRRAADRAAEESAEDERAASSEREPDVPPRERWTISSKGKGEDKPGDKGKAPRHMPDRDRVERRRMPR